MVEVKKVDLLLIKEQKIKSHIKRAAIKEDPSRITYFFFFAAGRAL
jgi:hypothetical protein